MEEAIPLRIDVLRSANISGRGTLFTKVPPFPEQGASGNSSCRRQIRQNANFRYSLPVSRAEAKNCGDRTCRGSCAVGGRRLWGRHGTPAKFVKNLPRAALVLFVPTLAKCADDTEFTGDHAAARRLSRAWLTRCPHQRTRLPLFRPGAANSTRSQLTGDWFGSRDGLAAHGLTFIGDVTQYYQGVTTGGLARHSSTAGAVII